MEFSEQLTESLTLLLTCWLDFIYQAFIIFNFFFSPLKNESEITAKITVETRYMFLYFAKSSLEAGLKM